MAQDDRIPELRFLKRLTLYKPNGQSITRLITGEGYQDGPSPMPLCAPGNPKCQMPVSPEAPAQR